MTKVKAADSGDDDDAKEDDDDKIEEPGMKKPSGKYVKILYNIIDPLKS